MQVAELGDDEDHNASDQEIEIAKVEACTTSTNTSDDYAHRGSKLSTMPFYIYRMYVRRIPRPSQGRAARANVFPFELHYALAKSYAQEVVLRNAHVPTIDGFQCPTVTQDAEQNASSKAIIFTPWSCTNPEDCGSVTNFKHFLSNGDASQLAASSSSSSVCVPCAPRRAYTFRQAWRLRRSEIHPLAGRADCRCTAARKRLVLADTILFAEMKEPLTEIQNGEATKKMLCDFCNLHLQQTMPAQGVRVILAFLGLPCKWHDEQCTLAEFSAYIARDVIAHIDLAAEAKIKKPKRPLQDTVSEVESDSDDAEHRGRPAVEFADMGGGLDDGQDDHDLDVQPGELSSFPLRDVTRTISLCFQQDDIASLPSKTRKSQGDVDLIHLDDTYGSLLHQNLSFNVATAASHVCGYGLQHKNMVALQKKTIALAKKQQSRGHDDLAAAASVGIVVPVMHLSLPHRSLRRGLWRCKALRPSLASLQVTQTAQRNKQTPWLFSRYLCRSVSMHGPTKPACDCPWLQL